MFQKTSLFTCAVVALFGGFGGLFLVNPPQEAAPRGPKFGFVNIFDVREGCERQKAIVARIEKEFNAAGNRIKEREEARRKQWIEELPLYEPGTAEFESLRTRLEVEEYQIKLETKALRSKLRREEFAMIEEYMEELRKVVTDYAEKNGYDAVYLYRPLPRIRTEDAFQAVHNQWVLYRNESLDLTQEITRLMNRS